MIENENKRGVFHSVNTECKLHVFFPRFRDISRCAKWYNTALETSDRSASATDGRGAKCRGIMQWTKERCIHTRVYRTKNNK